MNEVLGREKTQRSEEQVLHPAFTAVMQLAWHQGWKGEGQGEVFPQGKPSFQNSVPFQSCCSAVRMEKVVGLTTAPYSSSVPFLPTCAERYD